MFSRLGHYKSGTLNPKPYSCEKPYIYIILKSIILYCIILYYIYIQIVYIYISLELPVNSKLRPKSSGLVAWDSPSSLTATSCIPKGPST